MSLCFVFCHFLKVYNVDAVLYEGGGDTLPSSPQKQSLFLISAECLGK